SVLGPIVGAALFAAMSLPDFMLTLAIALLLSTLFAVFIKFDLFKEGDVTDKVEQNWWTDLKEGVNYIKGNAFLSKLIVTSLLLNFLFTAIMVYLPYISITIRKLSSVQFGIVESGIAIGMVITAVGMASRKEFEQKNTVIYGGVCLLGIIFCLIGLMGSSLVATIDSWMIMSQMLIICIFCGSILVFINIPMQTMLQRGTSDAYRGRLFSLLETGGTAIVPLGFALFGAMADYISPALTLVSIGIIQLSATALLYRTKYINFDAHDLQIGVEQ
ncbi:MAG: MFS transporter, partial [Bacilli bacterium]